MRIAFLGASLSQQAFGVKVVIESLSTALQQEGHEVRVFGLADEAWDNGDKESWIGAPATTFDVKGPHAFGYAPGLEHAILDFAPDILHTHGLWLHISAVSAHIAHSGIPNVISPHGMLDPWALKRARVKKMVARILYEEAHLRGARCLHALNKSEADAIRNFGLKNPLAIVPNGVDLSETSDSKVQPVWRERLPENAHVLLYFGRLHPKKNLASLIEAWSCGAREEWHLVIAGPDQNNHLSELETVVIQQGLESTVHFIGAQFGLDKQATFNAADAFILPSLSEGLPMAVLEAWSFGLPVLMTDFCNLPEGFEVGAAIRIGINAHEIEQGLSQLICQPAGRLSKIGLAGRALVERKYTWKKVAGRFGAIYDNCLGGSS